MTAAEILLQTVRDATPPGAPSPIREVTRAVFEGRGVTRSITAEVIMFDGLTASMYLQRWALGWSFAYDDMVGGPAWLNGDEWERETPYLPLFDAHPSVIKSASGTLNTNGESNVG